MGPLVQNSPSAGLGLEDTLLLGATIGIAAAVVASAFDHDRDRRDVNPIGALAGSLVLALALTGGVDAIRKSLAPPA